MKTSVKNQLKQKGFNLNAEQLPAVLDINGVSIIDSSPGVGKSTCIVAKIHAISMQDPCASILALSFSKKAVAELQYRLIGVTNCMVSTIHSFAYRILRSSRFYRNYKFIQNESEKTELLKRAIANAKAEDEVTIQMLQSGLSKGYFTTDKEKEAADFYFDLLKDNALLCFDSLLFFVLELLENDKSIARHVRNSIQYCLVDESNDLSLINYRLLKAIFPVDEDCNITYVGDPNQSIYSFRGSDPTIMQTVFKEYNASGAIGCKMYKLNTNYRCYQNILNLAMNILPTGQKLVAAKKGKGKITYNKFSTFDEEANYIINEIKRLKNSGVSLNDITIMFRSSFVSSVLFERLIMEKINVVRIGGDALRVNNSRFKAMLSLLALLYDPTHSIFYLKCALPILGIAPSIISYLEQPYNDDNELSLKDLLLSIPSLSKSQKAKVAAFFDIDTKKLSMLNIIIILYTDYLKSFYKLSNDNTAVLDEIMDIIGENRTFDQLRDYVFQIRRQCKQMQRLLADPRAEYCRLSSIHSMKGCQSDYVFIIGAADGVMPLHKDDTVIDLAEENRLAYVAVTRSSKDIYISYVTTHNGKTNSISPFFKELFEDN